MNRFPVASFRLPVITLLVLLILSGNIVFSQGTLKKEKIRSGDLDRSYWVYLPANYSKEKKLPLVLAFHGSGGTGRGTMVQFGFNPVADREGFMVVYPDGLHRGWNDGRIREKKPRSENDVQFVSDLIDRIMKDYPVDPTRIFATGMSNGAIFSIYLAYKIPNKILAIAPVCGSMPLNLEKEFRLSRPISALVINGTKDPLVRYDGGAIASEGSGKGAVLGTAKLIQDWVGFNGCAGKPVEEKLPDEANDYCSATMTTYSNCSNSTEVVLIRVEGGGHTWPGGKQYAPRFIIGKLCRDFDAQELIWSFFKRQVSQ